MWGMEEIDGVVVGVSCALRFLGRRGKAIYYHPTTGQTDYYYTTMTLLLYYSLPKRGDNTLHTLFIYGWMSADTSSCCWDVMYLL